MNSEKRRLGSPVKRKGGEHYETEDENSTTANLEDPENPEDIPGNQETKKPSGGLKAELFSWIQILFTAAIIAFVLNTFIIANSKVPSGSMENTIMTNDRVIGSRLTYRFVAPKQGDIAIFRFPDDESIYYVKRVIGLPGDTIDIRNGKVYRNGSTVPLDEPYLKEDMFPEDDMHFEVPEDCYFMMGDNRNFSYDARYWENTFVHRDKIIAKVMFRYWPLNKIGTIK
ncbi:MAG: signal peptidase I [Lachnospiraceae bacterium]|nr:signal peptidase I [Lachnospiraceae bacterium]